MFHIILGNVYFLQKDFVLKIGSYNSRRCGRVDVDLQNMDALFDAYRKDYSEIFNLNPRQIESLRKFKVKSGGELISLISIDKTLAVMTFRNINSVCKELGDVMKLESMFSRSDFAKGLSIASKFVAAKGCCIVSYPNKYSFPMILKAGYQVLKTYDKLNYVVLLGGAFLLPFDSHDRKLQINFRKFRTAPLFLSGLALRETRLRIKFLKVYAMSDKSFKIRNILHFGILYKYNINDVDNGLPIIFYGDCNPEKIPLGYEYSDNSA